MDISGPVRATLRRFSSSVPATAAAGGGQDDPIRLAAGHIVRAVAAPEVPLIELPPALAGDAVLWLPADPGDEAGPDRGAYRWLVLANLMRLLPRVARAERWKWIDGLRRQMSPLTEKPERLLAARGASIAAFFWWHYLLGLAGKHLGTRVPEMLMAALWRRGAGALPARQDVKQAGDGVPGPLHPLGAGESLDTYTYVELCALHAGFNAVVTAQDWDRMQPLERTVRWHVHNTQPDHATSEPWALAAFASLDETGTFAPQQLHDATARLSQTSSPAQPGAMALVLLADALLTQEAAAGV